MVTYNTGLCHLSLWQRHFTKREQNDSSVLQCSRLCSPMKLTTKRKTFPMFIISKISTESPRYRDSHHSTTMMINSNHAEHKHLPESFLPTDRDVICGWARQHHRHAGNRRFRRLVEHSAPFYVAARTKLEKTQVIAAVVEKVRKDSPRGGFVKRDFQSGRWFEIGDDKARDKVGHAIRRAIEETQKINGSQSKRAMAFHKRKSDTEEFNVLSKKGNHMGQSIGLLPSADRRDIELLSSAFQSRESSDSLAVPSFLYQTNASPKENGPKRSCRHNSVTSSFGLEAFTAETDLTVSNASPALLTGQAPTVPLSSDVVISGSTTGNQGHVGHYVASLNPGGSTMECSLGNSGFTNTVTTGCVSGVSNRCNPLISKSDFNPSEDQTFLSKHLCQTAANNTIFVGASNHLNSIHTAESNLQQASSFMPAVNFDGSFSVGSLTQNSAQMRPPGVDLLQSKLAIFGNDFLGPSTGSLAQSLSLPLLGSSPWT